ncbi:hypothetical protein JCGZ_01822 [Jatropha curcas]|uniref:Uncharacterized protein n=1 Tax=Jatropha curcas TaxID=180498 RepID=A0A067JRX2_JATCU|nr:hypothetical protein JCGZ_01822 [Jatropha curcas]
MANNPVEHPNMEDQGNNHGEASGQRMIHPPPTIDPHVAVALAQTYSQFTTVLAP